MTDWIPSANYRVALDPGFRLVRERSINGMQVLLTEEGDAWKTREAVTYADFITHVVKYRTSDVLKAIGAQPDDLFSPGRPMAKQRIINPWAAAAIVRESVLYGSEAPAQHDLSKKEIYELFEKFAHSLDEDDDRYDESGAPTQDWRLKTLTKLAYEQSPWQESIYEELARTATIFRGESTEHHVAVRAAMERALGTSVEDAIAAAVLIYAVATARGGLWDQSVLDTPGLEEALIIVPRESVETIAKLLTSDSAQFAKKYKDANARVKGNVTAADQRYAFNPAITYPICRLESGEHIVPIPHLLYRRLTPSTLYYDGFGDSKTDFTNPLGHVVGHYVGMQLREIGAEVFPEFTYKHGKNIVNTVDWFVALPDCLLFIESKSVRLILGERMGLPSQKDGVFDKLSEAIDQINTTYSKYSKGKKREFAHLPRNVKPIGMVVTSDPIYHGNSPDLRSRLSDPAIDILIVSLRDLERMATWDADALGKALVSIVNDPMRKTHPLALTLDALRKPALNPLLEATMKQLSIFAWSLP